MKTRRGGYTTINTIPNLSESELEEEVYALLGRINWSVPQVLYRQVLQFVSAKAQEVQSTDQTTGLQDSNLPEITGENRERLSRIIEILKDLGQDGVGQIRMFLVQEQTYHGQGGRRRRMRKTRRRRGTRRRV